MRDGAGMAERPKGSGSARFYLSTARKDTLPMAQVGGTFPSLSDGIKKTVPKPTGKPKGGKKAK